MKLCLIFSPFSSFTLVPLGISYLKSYIKKNIPSIQVLNLDLSNHFYHNFSSAEFLNNVQHLCQICPRNNKPDCTGTLKQLRNGEIDYRELIRISDGMISRFKTKKFYDAKVYNRTLKAYNVVYYA